MKAQDEVTGRCEECHTVESERLEGKDES